MPAGRKRSCVGAALLAVSAASFVLLLCSGRWALSLHTPKDRWRIALGSEYLGGGVLSLDTIRDPTAKFMIDFRAAARRQGPWSLEWRLPPHAGKSRYG